MKCILEINQHLRVAPAPPSNSHVCMMRSLLDLTKQLRSTPNHFNILSLLQKVEQIAGVKICGCLCGKLSGIFHTVCHENIVLINIITKWLKSQWFRGLISYIKCA